LEELETLFQIKAWELNEVAKLSDFTRYQEVGKEMYDINEQIIAAGGKSRIYK
jgi:hypothetical protein